MSSDSGSTPLPSPSPQGSPAASAQSAEMQKSVERLSSTLASTLASLSNATAGNAASVVPSLDPTDSKVWSPSQTETFSRCPRLWDLGRRWETFNPGCWGPERLVGNAVHAALAVWMRDRQRFPDAPTPLDEMDNKLGEVIGDEWPDDAPEVYTPEGAMVLARKALAAVMKKEPVPLTAKIVAVEHSFGESIVDLVYLMPEGLYVLDWKTHAKLEPHYRQARMDETIRTHQLWHYAWRARQKWMHSVVAIEKVAVALQPSVWVGKRSEPITDERIDKWYEGASSMWRIMDAMRAGRLPVHPRFEGCGIYGGCPLLVACHMHGADESKFEALNLKRKVWR